MFLGHHISSTTLVNSDAYKCTKTNEPLFLDNKTCFHGTNALPPVAPKAFIDAPMHT